VITEIELGHVHGSCVDFNGKSILAIGPSGSGKTSLILDLIALGGVLVADDQVILSEDANGITVSAPHTIAGKIEVRGIGILSCPHVNMSYVNLIVDLSAEPLMRLPEINTVKIGSVSIEIIAGGTVQNLPITAKILNLYGRDLANEKVL